MKKFSSDYWNIHYLENRTGWDIGYVSTPIREYIDQLEDKEIRILVPGAGNAYEVEYLFINGFQNVYLLDFSERSILNFIERCPEFPAENIFLQDFFDHHGQYDLIIEQTFFSSLPLQKRHLYVEKMHSLLKSGGKLTGLLFAREFPFEGPPFGGDTENYNRLFSSHFDKEIMEIAYNSIKPRMGNEFFFIFRKKMS
jgi:thiopurine S-methyltransferase